MISAWLDKPIVGLGLIFGVLLSGQQQVMARDGLSDRIVFTGQIESRIGGTTSNTTFQLAELEFTPEFNFDVSDNWRLTAIGRARFDASDKLEPGKPADNNRSPLSRRAFLGQDIDLELREFYLDGEVGDLYLRLGKQQVVWGQADGIKVLDVINPQTYREFILPDFDKSRIPLWMAKTELPLSDETTLQLVWVPDQTYHDIPASDAAFAFTTPQLVPQATPGVPIVVTSMQRPDRFLADSDAGLRLTTFVEGWELSLNYFYHYADTPITRRNLDPAGVTISNDYERTHLIGGTFSNAFGNFVVRGEAGYSTSEYFRTNDLNDTDGVSVAGEFSYVLGVDWTGLTDVFLSAQFFQSIISDRTPSLVRGSTQNMMTLYARQTFINETVEANVLLIHSLDDGDGVVQAEITYQWRDNIDIYVGSDIFYGTSAGLFGEFKNNNRIVTGLRYGF